MENTIDEYIIDRYDYAGFTFEHISYGDSSLTEDDTDVQVRTKNGNLLCRFELYGDFRTESANWVRNPTIDLKGINR